MKRVVRIDGRDVELDLHRDGDGWIANGRAVSAIEVEPGVYSVLMGGQSYEARVERTLEAWAVTVRACRYEVEVIDPRQLVRGPGRQQEGRQRVVAPMPGKIVRVLVAEGDQVEAGQGMVVVEAMKMQNEMKAPKGGRVVSFTAREGATVGAGEVLGVIE